MTVAVRTPPLLVCVHGLGGHAEYFDGVIRALGDAVVARALDLPYHGARRQGGGTVSIAAWADDVVRAITVMPEWRDARPIVVMGHSLGAAVAVEVARRLPGRVRQVIALDALLNPRVYPAQPAWLVRASRQLSRWFHPLLSRALLRVLMPPPRDEARFASIAADLLALPAGVAADASASLAAWDRDAALDALDAALLILPARRFHRPALAAALVARARGRGRVLEPVEGSHFFLLEDPVATARRLHEGLIA